MSEPELGVILVQTTSDDQAVLKKIGRQLVLERLAACIQIGGPVESQFDWEGKIDTVREWVCTAKTTREAWPRVLQTIQEMHNYDTPEIIALPIWSGSDAYLSWVRANVSA